MSEKKSIHAIKVCSWTFCWLCAEVGNWRSVAALVTLGSMWGAVWIEYRSTDKWPFLSMACPDMSHCIVNRVDMLYYSGCVGVREEGVFFTEYRPTCKFPALSMIDPGFTQCSLKWIDSLWWGGERLHRMSTCQWVSSWYAQWIERLYTKGPLHQILTVNGHFVTWYVQALTTVSCNTIERLLLGGGGGDLGGLEHLREYGE